MDHCGNQAFNAAELKYTVAKRSNRCIPPKPSKGNEAYTGGGSVCSGKKRKQKIQEVLQNPPPTRRPKIKGILISALVESVRGRKREEKQLVEEKDMREGNKRGMLNKEVKVYFRWMRKIWLSRKLKQPAKLPELGMDPENEGIISDILRFVRKKAIYRKEGKPWKRGYLLFDSPGTADRSSLIAAMANRLEFDIFDLNLTGLTSISELTNVLVSIRKRSIIFIKDFDHWAPYLNNELTLSGLSKIIHGLLSSCGDEQIIVLTTNHNHIDGVDAALLRSLNNDLYIHTPSPRPKALSNGGEIVPLDSSEQKPMVDFDATNNRANQSDVLVSNSEEKNAREALRSLSEAEPCLVSLGDLMTGFSLTDFDDLDSNAHQHHVFSQGSPIATSSQGPPIATSAIITKDDLQRPHGSVTRKDAAAILRVSESTVKRIWKECKMGPWKNGGKRRVLRPPDPHGKRNTSIACETPHNVQPGMEGEPVGQNQEANVFRRDFMRGPIAWNTESGSIMVSRPPDQLGERNTSTACETPSHNVHTGMEGEPLGQNQDANEFRRDFMEHSIALNTENDSIIAVYSETEAAWGSSKWAFQLEGQTMQSTTYPYHDDLVFFQSQIASTEVVNENMGSSQDRRDLLASQVVAPQKEPLLEGHVFGFGNWTVDSCSDLASSQTMCNFSQATGSSENLENWLAFMEEHLKEENIYGPSRSDPAPSQPKRTIHHTMATIPHMMPLPTERQDMRSVKLKATYGDTKIKFQFPLTSGINELMEVMSKIMERELGSFKVEYKDEDGEWILITLDEHVREHLQLLTSLGNKVTELKVQDKVPNTTDIDAPESGACLVRANQSGPIMLNSEKKHTSEGLIGECLTESVLSLNDSTKRKSFSNFDATELKAHLVRAYQSGPVVSLPENQNRGEASKRECITKSIFGLEDLQQHCGGRPDAAAKSFRRKSFEVLETLPARKQPNDGVPLLLPGRLTQEKSPNLPRVMQFNGVEQRVTKMPRYLGGLTAQSASSSCGPIGLPDGGHIVLLDALDQSTKNIEHVATADQCSPTLSLPEKKMVRKTLNRNCRTMSVIFEEKHQRYVRRCEGATKSLGAMCISRKHGINQVSMVEPIHKQRGIHQWPFLQSAVGLPDGGHILSLLEKKIVRKTLKRKCRSMSVLSLEDHKQHVDRRWEDAAKSHGAKRICRQLVIHRLSTAKCIRKQIGIHQWPFQRSTIGLPDGGRILPLSEKKIVRKTLKRKCRSMSVLSLVDRQQHVDRRWEDAAKNIGAKRICRQLVIHRVFIAKRICRQHGIHHRWPFERDWATKKGYSLGDERPVEVICISTHAELVSRLQLIYLSWLGRFSPRPSALPRGGLIVGPIALSSSEFAATNYLAQRVGQHQSRVGLVVGPIALSSSEFAATNNLAQRVGQDQRGSGASGSENERTREQEDPRQDQRGSGASGSENERTRKQKDPKEKRTSITKDDLLQLPYRMTVEDAAAYLKVSKSTVKRKWGECNMGPWNKRVWRPPDQHGEGNTSTARETPSHNVQTGMEGEPVGQNQEANECQRDFRERQIALSTESGLIMVLRPPDQHGERNTSTAHETPSHNVQTGIEGVPVGQNQEANEFQPDFTGGSIPLNTENCLIIGSSFGWASQVNDQTLSAPDPNHDALVFSPPQITLLPSENRGVSIDLRNSVASQAEPFSDRHISGSRNLAFRTCSYQAAPSQHVEGQAMQSTDHNAFMFPQTQMVSPQEPFSDRHISRFSNFATCSDQAAPSQHVGGQSMPTVYPDPNAFEVSNWNKDTNSVEEIIIKAFCGERTKRTIYRFRFPLTSGIDDLKKEVSKRLNVEVDRFEVKYKDKKKQLISIPCDEDLMLYLSSSLENDDIEVFVLDKGRTPNFCERCRSSMQTRA